MNVLIPKALSYLDARIGKTMLLLLLLNAFAFYMKHASELTVYGRVEALDYRWITYSTLYKQAFHNRVVYSENNGPNTSSVSYINNYEESVSRGNSFISLGDSKSIAISHYRIFYLDDKCSLFFSGQDKLTMDNFSLQCFD